MIDYFQVTTPVLFNDNIVIDQNTRVVLIDFDFQLPQVSHFNDNSPQQQQSDALGEWKTFGKALAVYCQCTFGVVKYEAKILMCQKRWTIKRQWYVNLQFSQQ